MLNNAVSSNDGLLAANWTTAGAGGLMKIGITMPISEQADGEYLPYATIRALAQQAEGAGVDSLWIYDHVLYRYGDKPTSGTWECWTLMTSLAEATERVEIGSLVLCLPFRNPALTAKMADTFEEVSGGRLILGLGAGWHEPEFTAFGFPFDHLASRFEEGLQIIAPLLREGRVDFEGVYYQAKNAELTPRGPRAGGPPIMIASFAPRMLRLTAQYADLWNTAWLGQVEGLAEPLANLRAACAEVGRDPSTLEVTVGIGVTYSAPDAEPVDPLKALSGSPREIATQLRRYADAGVGHAICSLDPTNEETLAAFSDALREYRQLASPVAV
jgi:alkanesulfonate monooxygenase SsuD/methylene tetrahydromethanopterin reductase-like flavin-dependent oxidoreductase (luciferase family)